MIIDSIFVCFAALGFGIIFNIRGLKLFVAALGGGLTWLAYLVCTNFINSPTFCFFAASVMAAAYSEISARIVKTPVTTFIICAIIPLVPGSGMYYTILAIIQGNISKSIVNGVQTLAIAGAISVGIFFVSIVTKIIKRYKNKESVI